ncbi:hypothetical protein [Pseudomonas syringae group genomosp. 7]|nr:hypothetical protein [Pseudomonas syringae group genomosp. 7]
MRKLEAISDLTTLAVKKGGHDADWTPPHNMRMQFGALTRMEMFQHQYN